MNIKSITFLTILVTLSLNVNANCGCLKCSKHLTVISPPHQPCKIIYRDGPRDNSCPTPLPYKVQAPLPKLPLDCIPRHLDYKIALPVYTINNGGKNCGELPGTVHNVQVQAPLPIPTTLPCTFLTNLIAKADRVVIPRPPSVACPGVQDGGGNNNNAGDCFSIWQQIPTRNQYVIAENPSYQPIIQELPRELYCECRYGTTTKNRQKRSLLGNFDNHHGQVGNSDDLVKSSMGFLLDLVPNFIKMPIGRTLRNWRNRQELENRLYQPHRPINHQYNSYYQHKPIIPNVVNKYSVVKAKPWKPPPNKYLLLRKLKKLNEDDQRHQYYNNRAKRSTVFDSSELQLPFFQIRDLGEDENSLESNQVDSSEEDSRESSESGEVLKSKYRRHQSNEESNLSDELLAPFHAQNLIPHNPIFYFLNAPIRFLHHFHNIGRQISPVFKSVPHVLVNSRRYLRNFGRNFKNDVLEATSDLIGDFDDFGRVRPASRYRRSVTNVTNVTESDDAFVPNFDEVVAPKNNRKSNREWLKKLTDVMKTMKKQPKKRDVADEDNLSFEPEYVTKSTPEIDYFSVSNTTDNDSFFQFLTELAQNDVNRTESAKFDSAEFDKDNFDQLFIELTGNDTDTNRSQSSFTELLDSESNTNLTQSNSTKSNLEPYEPEYSLVFEQNLPKTREKRYILKVVDEDEVQDFLREKLSKIYDDNKPKAVKPKSGTNQAEKSPKKRMLVEKLSPKVILDNNGLPFMEINGVKRPLFFGRKSIKKKNTKESEDKTEKPEVEKDEREDDKSGEGDKDEDMQTKISNLIEKARKKVEPMTVQMSKSGLPPQEVSTGVVRDKIGQILDEIQNLINTDFDQYAIINKNLVQLESFKDFLVQDWRKVLSESKTNDMSSKIRILDNFKELQLLKDESVKNIASVLDKGSNFMLKRLIKTLVRLQKLQCVIYRVVDDFGEKIKMGTLFDMRKESKYVDYLGILHFSVGNKSQHDFNRDLRHERDLALENELILLEDLRHLLAEENSNHLQEEARLLWEIKNIEKLQKDAIAEMNLKISRGQKVRKELKILFDLLRQQENCDEKQRKLLRETHPNNNHNNRHHHHHRNSDETIEDNDGSWEIVSRTNRKRSSNDRILKPKKVSTYFGGNFGRHLNNNAHTIIEDKKPVKIISNGYTLNAYKLNDF